MRRGEALGLRWSSVWRRIATAAARSEARAVRDWATHTRPTLEHLDRRITRAEHRVAQLEADTRFRYRWLGEHPDLARRIQHTTRTAKAR
jgi:hypothetical protein